MRKVTALSAVVVLVAGCSVLGPSRERAIQGAIDQVKETMRVALPDVPHPEPYEYEDAGDCALIPGLNSTQETLRYQAEIRLPVGDDGIERQARAVRYWIDKGATIRELPYYNGPPNEVNYRGGSIMAFSTASRPGNSRSPDGSAQFWIVATTPCIPKVE